MVNVPSEIIQGKVSILSVIVMTVISYYMCTDKAVSTFMILNVDSDEFRLSILLIFQEIIKYALSYNCLIFIL